LRERNDEAAINDALAAFVRRHDPDRFLTALFAPAAKRNALLALYAFNHELARAREVASEPAMALIRLQWWREVVEGAHRFHEVATPLTQAMESGALDRGVLEAIIEAREIEAEPAIAALADWRAWLLGVAGGVAVAAAHLLGAAEPEALRPLGAAYGAGGVLRGVSALARQRRCLLPADVLAAHGLTPEGVVLRPDTPDLRPALLELAQEGRALLAAGPRRLPRSVVAAALPAVLARRDLRRVPLPVRPRGFGDRFAVMRAGLTGIL
jgi:phytoene synthase